MAKAEKAEAPKTEEASTNSGGQRGRAVILTHVKTGKTIRRIDYIQKRYYDDNLKAETGARRKILDELKELYNHEIPYQIVFQATKTENKPEKKVGGAKPAEGASEPAES